MKRTRFPQRASRNKATRGAASIQRKDTLDGGQTRSKSIGDTRAPAAAQHGSCLPLKTQIARHSLSVARHVSPHTKIMKLPNVGPLGPQGQVI